MKSLLTAALALTAGALAASAQVTSFPIGQTWPDTEGVHINCHGGCVVPYEGAFYWFGESRTGGHSDGISVYRSTDLYNWENLGFAVTHGGTRDDVNMQDISEGRLLERPKVIYNKKTNKWVMWAHWENGSDYGQARVAILKADKLTGPYEFVSTMRPNGHDSRDQTLFLDTDGNAYHFCSTNMNTDINVVRLSDDFLTPSKNETLIMKGRRLEASTVCKVDEMYFATFSECNGWDPAPGHSATAIADPLGTWTEGLNFCIDSDARRSYRSQGAFVFSVEQLGYDPKCFIFYGDRWNSSNVGGSTYVWLPLSVRSGYPTVRNLATWDLDEVMSKMYRYKRAAAIEAGKEYSLLERQSDRMVSRLGRQAGMCIMDDNDRYNLHFIFEATSDPYVWKLKDSVTKQYLCAFNGRLRFTDDASGDNVRWRFVLLSDGTYNVVNQEGGECLSVAANERTDGAEVRLATLGENDAQGFGVYFDSDAHPDYAEAPMYTKAYYDEVARKIAEQNYVHNFTGVQSLPFEADKPFAVIHTMSGLALTFTGIDHVELDEFDQLPEQKITFVAAPAGSAARGYNIKDGSGCYLYKEGNYSTRWTADPDLKDATFIFTPEEVDGRLYIKCADGGLYLGTDDSTVGAEIYSDKQAEGRKLSYWRLADFNDVKTVTDEDRFIEALDEMDIMHGAIDPALCGTDPFDYSESVYKAFTAALEKALKVNSGFAAAIDEISAAIEAFNANKFVLPESGKAYVFKHVSGTRLTATDDESPVLELPDESKASHFNFILNDDGTYALLNLANNLYLSNKSGSSWDMAWTDDATSRRAKWGFDINSKGYKVIYCNNIKAYVGADNSTPGSHVYCNKGKNDDYSCWKIVAADKAGIADMTVDTTDGIDFSAPCEVYNLSGIRVSTSAANLPAGLYIIRQGSNVRKIAVK